MESAKVEQFYNKNQFIITTEKATIFQSYNSTVAKIENGCLTLGRDWDYSKTTMKHLYLFLGEFIRDSQINDALYSCNKRAAIQKLIDEGAIEYDEEM